MTLFSTLRKKSRRFTALVIKFGTFTTWNALGFDLVQKAKQIGHKELYQMVLSAKNASLSRSKPLAKSTGALKGNSHLFLLVFTCF